MNINIPTSLNDNPPRTFFWGNIIICIPFDRGLNFVYTKKFSWILDNPLENCSKKPTKNRYFEYYLIFAKIRFLPIFFERIVLKSWNLQGKYKIWFSIQWYITLGIKKKIFFFSLKIDIFGFWPLVFDKIEF